MRTGRRVAIDVGKVRIGIAASDFHGILASPLTTVSRATDLADTVSKISEVIASVDPLEIYVGLPVNLSGHTTESTLDAIRLAQALQESVTVPVRMMDERLSTVVATGQLRSSGKNAKQGRKSVDEVAATIILEGALATERSSGQLPGIALGEIHA